MSSPDGSDQTLGAPGGDSSTSSALLANLILRVVLSVIANLACWVPMRLLWRNGEFAAVVFIITVMVLNFDTIINALIWRDDNLAEWWPGYGFCDFHNYYGIFLSALYASSNMAIMRNLATQVGLMRANPLSIGEKRRRNLIQALVMFPVPLISVAWIYPLTVVRYIIGSLVGCSTRLDNSWPSIVFISLPPPLFAIGSTYYAVVTWFRFRQVRKTTRSALMSNSTATARSDRAKRKLYLMAMSILIPYLPLTVAFFVASIIDYMPLVPYSYNRIHYDNDPYPWDTIFMAPSSEINFTYLNANYIPIITAVPIFWFFGLTKDAINTYRTYLLALGFGKLFPSLREEYDPDRPRTSANASHWGSSVTTQPDGDKSFGATTWGSRTSKDTGTKSPPTTGLPDLSLNNIDIELGPAETSHARMVPTSTDNSGPATIPPRTPFLMRKHLNLSIPLKFLPLPGFRKKSSYQDDENSLRIDSVAPVPGPLLYSDEMRKAHGSDWNPTSDRTRVHTRVWSEDGGSLRSVRTHENSDELGPRSEASSTYGVVVQTHIASSSEQAGRGARGD